jgi:hypothetical protein
MMTKSRLGIICCTIAAFGFSGISALKTDHSMETIRAVCDEFGRCWETGSGYGVGAAPGYWAMSFMRREIGRRRTSAHRASKTKEIAKHIASLLAKLGLLVGDYSSGFCLNQRSKARPVALSRFGCSTGSLISETATWPSSSSSNVRRFVTAPASPDPGGPCGSSESCCDTQ